MKNKSIILLVIVCLLVVIVVAVGGIFLFQSKKPENPEVLLDACLEENKQKADYQALHTLLQRDKQVNWLFAGDSITHGCMHTGNRRNFSELFEQYIKTEGKRGDDIIINTAVSGATTQELGENFSQWIEVPKSDVAFVCFGMNDCTKDGMTVEIFSKNLRKTVEKLRQMGAIPILQTPSQANKKPKLKPYVESIRKIAEEESVLLVDANKLWNNDKKLSKKWMSDTVHPNAAGHLAWCRFLLESIGVPTEQTKLAKLSMEDVATPDGENLKDKPVQTSRSAQQVQQMSEYVENDKAVNWIFAGGASTQGVLQSYSSRNYVQHFQEVIRWEIGKTAATHTRCYKTMTNVARDGETVANLLSQYDERIGQFHAQVLFLMPEVRDSSNNWVESEAELFKEQLNALVERAQSDSMKVVVTLLPKVDDRVAQYNEIIMELEGKGVLIVGDAADENSIVHFTDDFFTQGGYFNERGQLKMAKSLVGAMVDPSEFKD